jgi:hypothetical protein
MNHVAQRQKGSGAECCISLRCLPLAMLLQVKYAGLVKQQAVKQVCTRRKERARAFLCINNMQQVCKTPDCLQAKRCISLTAAPSKVHFSP